MSIIVELPTALVARYRAVDREFVGSAIVDTPSHLDALTEDIRAHGILEPLSLGFNDEFAALDGNHRLAAAIRLGLESVPVELMTLPTDPRPSHAQPMLADDLATVIEAQTVVRLRAAGCVFAEDEARILIDAATGSGELESMVGRRVGGLPLEQIVGWAQFAGLRIVIEPGVFVPRMRTEFLVELALGLAPRKPVVVDLCCGTGALGAALTTRLVGVELYAADIDPVEVHCARLNILPPGQVFEGDLFEALPDALRGRVDILAVNAPYVPTGEIRLMPPEARLFEPNVALDGGADGLDVQRRVAAEAPDWLAPGGHLLIETSDLQARETVQALEAVGLVTRVEHSDDRDATVVIGTKN